MNAERQIYRSKTLLRITFFITFIALLGYTSGFLMQNQERGEAKKITSGKSFRAETSIASAPSPAAAAGFDSERVWGGEDDWEPAVAADPSSSYVYQLTTRYSGPAACKGCPFPVIVFRKSSDGGNTWNNDQFLYKTKKKQNDPQIEVALDGTIYVAWLDSYNPGVKFIKSTNRGQSWTAPITFTGKKKKPKWSDKPVLAISPDGRDVYIAFNSSDSYVAASHDYGATFSSNVKTNDDTRYWFHNSGTVAPDGTVYFGAVDYSQDYSGDSHINVLSSTDGGTSWTTTRIDTSREMPDCSWADGCYFGFMGPSIGMASDSTGRIVVAYNAGNSPGAAQKMYVQHSANSGATWSGRIDISDTSSSVHNLFPAVANGSGPLDFRVVWQDDRNGNQTSWNSWYRSSSDGGATWSTTVRLSDLGSGAPYKTTSGYKFPYGDYLEIAVDSTGQNHFTWGEGDSYTGPGGTWYTKGE